MSGCERWEWKWMRSTRDRPSVLFHHHPKTHFWATMADEAGTYHLFSPSVFFSIPDAFFFATGTFPKEERGDYFFPEFLPLPFASPNTQETHGGICSLSLSLSAHHASPLPSASSSIHSQPTPVVEKSRVDRVHPIP